jgi:hypothetical protein
MESLSTSPGETVLFKKGKKGKRDIQEEGRMREHSEFLCEVVAMQRDSPAHENGVRLVNARSVEPLLSEQSAGILNISDFPAFF